MCPFVCVFPKGRQQSWPSNTSSPPPAVLEFSQTHTQGEAWEPRVSDGQVVDVAHEPRDIVHHEAGDEPSVAKLLRPGGEVHLQGGGGVWFGKKNYASFLNIYVNKF